MEKTVVRHENGEDDAVAAIAVRTSHTDRDRVQLDGDDGEQASVAHERPTGRGAWRV